MRSPLNAVSGKKGQQCWLEQIDYSDRMRLWNKSKPLSKFLAEKKRKKVTERQGGSDFFFKNAFIFPSVSWLSKWFWQSYFRYGTFFKSRWFQLCVFSWQSHKKLHKSVDLVWCISLIVTMWRFSSISPNYQDKFGTSFSLLQPAFVINTTFLLLSVLRSTFCQVSHT